MIPSRFRGDDGFSLVELLVAILIVGVLLTIGLATLLNQRAKAQDTAAKAAVATAAQSSLASGSDHDGFAGAKPADLVKLEPSLGQARNLTVESTATTFTVSVDSASANAAFTIERSSDGETIRGCSSPATGACRAVADARGNRW
jgi:prepilin-type N-terminal cleavage/methylation domain-containing protein